MKVLRNVVCAAAVVTVLFATTGVFAVWLMRDFWQAVGDSIA